MCFNFDANFDAFAPESPSRRTDTGLSDFIEELLAGEHDRMPFGEGTCDGMGDNGARASDWADWLDPTTSPSSAAPSMSLPFPALPVIWPAAFAHQSSGEDIPPLSPCVPLGQFEEPIEAFTRMITRDPGPTTDTMPAALPTFSSGSVTNFFAFSAAPSPDTFPSLLFTPLGCERYSFFSQEPSEDRLVTFAAEWNDQATTITCSGKISDRFILLNRARHDVCHTRPPSSAPCSLDPDDLDIDILYCSLTDIKRSNGFTSDCSNLSWEVGRSAMAEIAGDEPNRDIVVIKYALARVQRRGHERHEARWATYGVGVRDRARG